VFLGLVPLTAEEKRSRRRMIRVAIYGYGAVLLALLFAFPKYWWAVTLPWFVVGMILSTWYSSTIRKAARERRAMTTPEERAEAQRVTTATLSRAAYLTMFSGCAFLVAGFFARKDEVAIFVVAGLLITSGVVLTVRMKVVR
jgi:hypothetical protein